MLRLEGDYEHRKAAMLCTSNLCEEEATCWALLVGGIYMTTNASRNRCCLQSDDGSKDELKQHVRNGVEGHPKSRKALEKRWCTP